MNVARAVCRSGWLERFVRRNLRHGTYLLVHRWHVGHRAGRWSEPTLPDLTHPPWFFVYIILLTAVSVYTRCPARFDAVLTPRAAMLIRTTAASNQTFFSEVLHSTAALLASCD